MTKLLHKILFLSAFLLVPGSLLAEAAAPDAAGICVVEEEEPVVTLSGSSLRVQNAAGAVLEIYNITGIRVAALKVDSNDKTFNLTLSRGCYIVKVGKTVRKISIL